MAMTADVYLKFDPEVARLVRTQDRVRIGNPADSVATDLTTCAGKSTAPDGRLGRSEPPDATSDSPLPSGATMRTPGLEPGWVAPPAPKAGASTNFATSANCFYNITPAPERQRATSQLRRRPLSLGYPIGRRDQPPTRMFTTRSPTRGSMLRTSRLT